MIGKSYRNVALQYTTMAEARLETMQTKEALEALMLVVYPHEKALETINGMPMRLDKFELKELYRESYDINEEFGHPIFDVRDALEAHLHGDDYKCYQKCVNALRSMRSWYGMHYCVPCEEWVDHEDMKDCTCPHCGIMLLPF